MNILLINASTKDLSLAVAKNEKVVAYQNKKLDKVLSSSIMPSIEGILKKAKLTLKRIDGFVVGLGPGSFTSLRVSLATVKGLSFALKVPVIGAASLDALALSVPQVECQVCVVSDARRNLVYACFYQKKGNILKRTTEYLLVTVEELLLRIKGDVIFIGDGIPFLKDKVNVANCVSEKFWQPQAKHLLPIALPRFQQKMYDDIDTLVPLYLYAADCQVTKRNDEQTKR